jgi:hypothetical protein
MTLAISKPANLRDKLTKTFLQLPEGDTVSSKLTTKQNQIPWKPHSTMLPASAEYAT